MKPSNEIEKAVYEYFEQIDSIGGVIAGIERGYFHREIAESAFKYQRDIEENELIVIGVNEHVIDERVSIPVLRMDADGEARQIARLNRVKEERNSEAVQQALAEVRSAAEGTQNLMPCILEAVRQYATLGEICDVLRDVFGEYQAPCTF